nr:MAG TPA: Replication initiation and membrane attachment [Caudoviricetes sp.]
MKEEEQKSIVIYKSWKKPLRKLSLEQKGRIFDALLDFPDPPDFEDDQKLEMAWDFMSEAVESNSKKWNEKREKRAAAGRKGAEVTNGKRQQNAANPANADFDEQKQQNAANPAVNGNGNVNGNGISPNGGVYNSAAPAAVDVELSKIVQHYQQAVGDFPRSALDKLQKWRQEYSTEMILLAIDKAAEAGKRSWNYINGILSGWKRDGLRTPGDVEANEQSRQTRPRGKQPTETVDDQLARVLAKMDRERGFEK